MAEADVCRCGHSLAHHQNRMDMRTHCLNVDCDCVRSCPFPCCNPTEPEDK